MNHLNRYTARFGKKLLKDEAFVLISEEFGYRYWFWFPEVSQKELIKIWKNTPRIDKFNFGSVLPGKFILAGGANIEWSMKEEWFYYLYGSRTTWIADIFDDCDSLLITSFPRRYIYHKGRHEANMLLQKEMAEIRIGMTENLDVSNEFEEKEKQANFELTMLMTEMDPNFYGQENPMEYK
jgi:hypothetical protein